VPDRLIDIVEQYLVAVRDVHRLGAGTRERAFYPALAELLNSVGQELKPKVLCLSDLGNIGAQRIKSLLREDDNPLKRAFVIDVNVETVRGVPQAYRVMHVHSAETLP
jgi:hypothetical protein